MPKSHQLFIFETRLACLIAIAAVISSTLVTAGWAQQQVEPQVTSNDELTANDGNQDMNLEAARQQYLAAWNNTEFSSQYDVFIEEGSDLGYGIYTEHITGNVFRPGETITLYIEPVGFGHGPINSNTGQENSNITTATATTSYLVNMTADYVISDSTGSPLHTVEDIPVLGRISHRQNTELFLTVTIKQDQQQLPVGDYIITYTVHDEVSGDRFEKNSFELDKRITIDDNMVNNISDTIKILLTLQAVLFTR